MPFVTRPLLLQLLAEHGPLSALDLAREDLLGFVPDSFQLSFLLHQLLMDGKIVERDDDSPVTYALPGAAAPKERAVPAGATTTKLV